MSDPPPGKQSKTSRLLRPIKGLFSKRSFSPSHQRVQSVISHNATTASTPQVNLNPEGTEYTAILELSTTPSCPRTWEHWMKEWGGTAYEGLKLAIQGIYEFSGSFPPLRTTAGVLLMISKVVDVCGSFVLNVSNVINVSFRPSESFSE